jgi:hypothetical protein
MGGAGIRKQLFIKQLNFMYEKINSEPCVAKQPEHLEIAQRFSNEMMDRFNPEEVNEILHYIRQMFKERREMDIAEAQKKLAYLQKTIEDL